MEDRPRRRVYDSGLILQRRPVITAVAVTEDGRRAFLGLEGGLLEEYAIESSNESVAASLTARKPVVFKQPILSILPAIGANCLVLHTGDGMLRFTHSDTLEGRVMEKGPVLAAAISSDTTQTPLLGFVSRVGLGRVLKLYVHSIKAAGGRVADSECIWDVDLQSIPGPVNHVTLGWAGRRIVIGVNTRYYLAWGAKGNESTGVVKGSLMELLAMEQGTGPVRLAPLPKQKAVILVTGSIAIAVNAVGEAVGNPISLEGIPHLQDLAVGNGLVAFLTMDGLHLYEPMAGKHIQSLSFDLNTMEVPLRASSGGSVNSKVILVASPHKVWGIVPLPASEQVRDLIIEGDLNTAEELTREGKSKGEKWAEYALVEVGRALINGGKLKEACSVLELCALSTFQPAELFELFPDYTSQWRAQWEAPRYWHINKPFQPLDSILQSTGNEELRYEDRKENSKTALIEYLLRARELPGIVHLDGIDTLLMHLFIDLRMHEQAAAFASMPNKVVLESVAPRLEQLGWHHSRATLTAARGHVPEALAIWKHIICSEQEGERHSPLEEWELKEARSSILSQLSDASSCSPSLALEYLPWALETFSEEVGKVLSSRRDFEPSVVLPLLKEGSTARWQYLSHLIEVEGMNDPYIHTMFALDLIKSIFSLKPSLQYPLPVHSSQPSKLSKDHGEGTGDDQPTPANGDAILVRRTTPIALVQSPNLSISHLVSYDDNDDDGKLEDKLMIDNVHRLRLKLRNHLEISSLWDEEKVFSLIQHSSLYEETVVVAWKTGDHRLALRILAMTLRDVGAAIQYASAYLAPEQHVDLLHMLLRPEDGSTPRWEDACCVVSAMGEALDPVEVLKVVPDSMPMPAVLHLVSPMLRERVHRRRSGQMTVAMLKCRAVKSSRNLVSVHSLSVIVNEQSTCSDCHLRIGGKVFVVLPTKSISEAAHKAITNNNSHLRGEEITILCFSCWNKRNRHANKENGHS